MLNCSASYLINTSLAQFVSDIENYDDLATESFQDMVGKRLDCVAMPRNAKPFPVEVVLSRVSYRGNLRFTCVMREVTEQRKAQREIQKLALYDQLRRVPNRYEFDARLKTAINMAQRQGTSVALMLLDLDRFKEVNDNFRHPVGDALLMHAAQVLEECVRDSDTMARIGGDEFAVILTNVDDPLRIRQVAERIVERLSLPTVLDGSVVVAGASVGISTYPRDALDAKELVRLGDQALYAAKNRGRGTFQYYDGVMDATARSERVLENDLRIAVVRDELELFFQPQVSVRSGAVMAVESLVRWRHPKGGMKSPAEFIGHAEKTGIIADIGKLVLRAACREARRWSGMGVGIVPVTVNVSPYEIRNPEFVRNVVGALDEAGIGPEWLELEITEHVALDMSNDILGKLGELKRLGIRLAIDDFGTGYASLA
jgi:diguanylate cyclase (GGDEF)-like protein